MDPLTKATMSLNEDNRFIKIFRGHQFLTIFGTTFNQVDYALLRQTCRDLKNLVPQELTKNKPRVSTSELAIRYGYYVLSNTLSRRPIEGVISELGYLPHSQEDLEWRNHHLLSNWKAIDVKTFVDSIDFQSESFLELLWNHKDSHLSINLWMWLGFAANQKMFVKFLFQKGVAWSGINRAFESGFLEIIQWAFEMGYVISNTDLNTCLTRAIGSSHFDIVFWWLDNNKSWVIDKKRQIHWCKIVGSKGRLDVLKRFSNFGMIMCNEVLAAVASQGRLEIIQWIFEQGSCTLTPTIITNAVHSGKLSIVQWLRTKNCPWDEMVTEDSSELNFIDIFKWATENGAPKFQYACSNFAKRGNKEAIIWAIENGYQLEPQTQFIRISPLHYVCNCAVKHLSLLKWLREEHDCEWNVKTIWSAIHAKCWDSVKWLVENGCPTTNTGDIDDQFSCCSLLAEVGELELLKWVVVKGLSFNSSAINNAARNGHIEVLQWLRQQNCPWPTGLHKTLLLNGYVTIVLWILDNGYPLSIDKIYKLAAKNDTVALLEWLKLKKHKLSENLTMSQLCTIAATHNNLEALKWLVITNGVVWDDPDLWVDVGKLHTETLTFAQKYNTSFCTKLVNLV